MEEHEITDIFERLSAMYDDKALLSHLVCECGNLVYESAKELKRHGDPIAVDYQLIAAIASVELAIDLVRHNVLSKADKTNLSRIRSARLIRMSNRTKPPIAP